MRPVFFLDMDDVLVVHPQYTSDQVKRAFKTSALDYPELWAELVFPEARENLQALHEEFCPQYVCSSRWTTFLTREQMQEVFRRTGLAFVADNLHEHWTTPKGTGSARVTEIEDWFWDHRQPEPMEYLVLVLDDHESGWNLHESRMDRQGLVVLCDPAVGFVREKLLDAQRLLRAQAGALAGAQGLAN